MHDWPQLLYFPNLVNTLAGVKVCRLELAGCEIDQEAVDLAALDLEIYTEVVAIRSIMDLYLYLLAIHILLPLLGV